MKYNADILSGWLQCICLYINILIKIQIVKELEAQQKALFLRKFQAEVFHELNCLKRNSSTKKLCCTRLDNS